MVLKELGLNSVFICNKGFEDLYDYGIKEEYDLTKNSP